MEVHKEKHHLKISFKLIISFKVANLTLWRCSLNSLSKSHISDYLNKKASFVGFDTQGFNGSIVSLLWYYLDVNRTVENWCAGSSHYFLWGFAADWNAVLFFLYCYSFLATWELTFLSKWFDMRCVWVKNLSEFHLS